MGKKSDMLNFVPEVSSATVENARRDVEDKHIYKGGLYGWVCPKCGRVYSPFTSMCAYCGNMDSELKVTC